MSTGETLTAYIVDSALHAANKYILCHTTAIECKLVLDQTSALKLLFGDSLQFDTLCVIEYRWDID